MPVTLTEDQLAAAINDVLGGSARLLVVASALVEKYAGSGTPDAVLNEGVIRVSGYLAEQPSSAMRGLNIDDLSRTWMPSHTSALRHSGAMALLSPWKVRRGVLA